MTLIQAKLSMKLMQIGWLNKNRIELVARVNIILPTVEVVEDTEKYVCKVIFFFSIKFRCQNLINEATRNLYKLEMCQK